MRCDNKMRSWAEIIINIARTLKITGQVRVEIPTKP